MNDDRPSHAADEQPQKTWLKRLGQVLQTEPRDREELVQTLRDAHDRELLDNDSLAMIEGVMAVSEMQVRDVMIPRSQIAVVERDASLEEILPVIIESAHSRFPVIGDNRDEVVGILLAKDLLRFAMDGEKFNIREVLRPGFFVPESKRLNVLLKEFRSSRNHMAVVVDEYGGVAGLVTIEDVLEQIVGEIEDEHDIDEEEGYIIPVSEGEYTVRALTPIDMFNEEMGTDFGGEFDTLGGLLLGGFGHLPKRDEQIDLGGLRFKVLRADTRRIHLVHVSRAPEEGDGSDTDEDSGDESEVS